jgi:hypothetical protein
VFKVRSKIVFLFIDDGKLPSDAVKLRVGDGWEGDASAGPFDVIHVGAAAETIPKALVIFDNSQNFSFIFEI